jgi:hypothetical protein
MYHMVAIHPQAIAGASKIDSSVIILFFLVFQCIESHPLALPVSD